jgi:hypothetical protein
MTFPSAPPVPESYEMNRECAPLTVDFIWLGVMQGLAMVKHDAIGKINQLRRELIACREDFFTLFAIERGDAFEFAAVFVRILQSQMSFRSDQRIFGNIAGAEAACKRRLAFAGKAQHCAPVISSISANLPV